MDGFTIGAILVGAVGLFLRLAPKKITLPEIGLPTSSECSSELSKRLAELDDDAAAFEYQAAVLASASKEQRKRLREALRINGGTDGRET